MSPAQVLRVRLRSVMTIFAVMLLLPAFGTAQAGPADDAVFNGEFEIAAHAARGTTCQVFGNGYINLFDPDNPAGLPWLVSVSPCQQGTLKAAQWSSGMTSEVGDFDGDGDREIKFLAGSADANIGDHNLWQAYPNPHQAFTGNFTELQVRVEGGTVPTNAAIRLSFSASPLTQTHPWLVLFIECNLAFGGDLLVPGPDNVIRIDPTEGRFTSAWPECDGIKAAWDAAEPRSSERREILDGLRLVQHSYWSWNSGSGDVVIDGISMVGSRTAAHALLS